MIYDYDNPTDYGVQTSHTFRDPAAWYHICFAVDTTQDIDLDRVKLFVKFIPISVFFLRTYKRFDSLHE